MALTALTVAAASFHLITPLAIGVALLIAAIKGAPVASTSGTKSANLNDYRLKGGRLLLAHKAPRA